MAARVLLLLLLAGGGETNGSSPAGGLSDEDGGPEVISSKSQGVAPRPESVDGFIERFPEYKSRLQSGEADVSALPNVALRLNDRRPNAFDSKESLAKQTVTLNQPDSAAELTLNRRSESADGGAEGAIEARGSGPRTRHRRSWLWNQFFVIEEYRGPEPVLIGRLHTDMDLGDGRTKYTLEGEGVGSVFVIDGNTGNIHVTKSLDREEKDQYRLVATATDRQTGRALEPSSEFIIRVQDINDNPPVFHDEPYVAVVPEMANIGTSIITVTARDADDPTYGNSARLVYAITQGQDHFSVDPQTGVLRTAVPDMDRETRDQYLVVLQARDMGGHLGGMSGTTTVTVRLSDVNDNPPHFRRSAWSFSVSELAAPGVEVGRLSAGDPDMGENALLEFSILDAEEADMFNITGRDREAVIVLNKLLDYESCSSYSFSVEVSNPVVDARYLRKGPFKDRTTVRVMVLNADEPPRFSRGRYRLDVSENCAPVCSVGRVEAVDPDTGQSANIRFSVDPQSDPQALFRIASDSGFITTVTELDREEERWHNITVIATQRDNPNLVSRVVVAIETMDQNDNAPELDRQYSTSVCDSSAAGQVVQVLRAIDRDQGSEDAPVHFSIPPESSAALNLSIRETGGVTASLVLRSALEPLSGFASPSLALYVPVVLRDGASGLTNTATVTVTVCPCLSGGMRTEDRGRRAEDRPWERRAVCLPLAPASPSLVFSLVTLLAMLACVTSLLVVCALSLSLRHQKRDAHCPFEDDDVRENIISYDDEGGGEADTAAFDITALQSMHRMQHMHNNRNIWYTQQNAARARAYSWNRNPGLDPHQRPGLDLHQRPGLDPQQRPGSAPLYGRLCYGMHTLPVIRDYVPVGPLEAGLQLTQMTRGLSGGRMGNTLAGGRGGDALAAVPDQSTFEPRRAPETSAAGYAAQRTLPKSKVTGREEGNDAAGTRETEDTTKMNPTEATESTHAADTTDPTTESSCRSQSSCSSNQQEVRPGSSQTQASTGATSCTLDDLDTDSSIPSVSERNYSTGGELSTNPPAYLKADSYSVVGSLNPSGGGASGGVLHPAAAHLLSMCGLQRQDSTPLPLPGRGLFDNNRGSWAACELPARAEPPPPANVQPLRMEDLLNIRLDRVTFDLSQPPYDSLQTYEFEGRDSRAESLSSLESDGGEKDGGVKDGGVKDGGVKDGWRAAAGGMEELNQKFQRLVEIIREREQEKEGQGEGQQEAPPLRETHEPKDGDSAQQRWDF
ncbi:cadherin-24 [Clinocottus analis]|uniref:cadherin-24 n=1 Tax=Clinocottus analis TaxID=304258 RepID=UPI0035C0648D